MDCAAAKPQLESYAAGRLQGPDREDLERHLATCEECAVAIELLRTPKDPPSEDAADWTVAKIFDELEIGEVAAEERALGRIDEGRDGSAERPDAPPVVPMFDVAPSGLGAPAPPDDSASHPTAKAESAEHGPSGPNDHDWGFEPADANLDVAPPEDSVVLAKEALSVQRKPAQRRSAALRVLLWSVGGVAGVGLLGASVWIAISAQQAPPAAVRATTRVATQAPEPPASFAQDDGAVPPRAAEAPIDSAPTALAPPTTAGASNPTGEVATAKPVATSPIAAAPRAAAPVAPKPVTKATTAKVTTRTPAPAAPAPRPPAPSATASTEPSTPLPLQSTARDEDDDMWPTDVVLTRPPTISPPPASAAPAPASEPKPVERVVRGDDAPAAPPATSTTTAPEPAPAPASSDTPTPEPADTAPKGTIQRLHEATEQAAAAADLDGLRKLRDAWRSHLKSVVGPTRSRVKREYADCLWAVQLLTGRADDQRDALVAYRDFLLSAPAGGTDSRSAARLRQLEDVLAGRR